MIILDATTKSLEVVLAGAKTTNDCPFVCSYVDVTTSAYTPGENDGVTNGSTAVSLAAAPGASTQRQVKLISIQNADTAAVTATVQYNNNSTKRTIFKATLATGYNLVYTDGEGFRVFDTNGAMMGYGATGASGLAGGTLTGAINLGENFGIELDAALSADGKYSGVSEDGTAGAALSFGQLCYLNNDDSRWELADANLSDGYDKKLGICVLAATGDGSATKMLLWGKVRADAQFPTLTVGAPAYMSETAGAIVTAQPTTTDAAIRVVGFGNTADELFFCPSPDYVTHV